MFDGFREVAHPRTAAAYRRQGWWGDRTLVDHLRRHARDRPTATAYLGDDGSLTWGQLDRVSDRIASLIHTIGCEPGDRVAVWLPDGGVVHAAYLGAEKAGVTVVGVGARAGSAEVAHLLGSTGARTLVTTAELGGRSTTPLIADAVEALPGPVRTVLLPQLEVDVEAPFAVDGEAVVEAPSADVDACRIRADDLFFINSTSGTTGLPKCVLHTQNRWLYFHQLAVDHADLGNEVTMSLVPAPFGFGLWTAHFTPIALGARSVLQHRFDAAAALDLIESERVTMLSCVSTQFLLMLQDPRLDDRDLSSLRVMFTGGEAVPTERARAFEQRTGCSVLQFYGSNETGVLSGTRLTDDLERRTTTAGRVVPEMQVRLFDSDGRVEVEAEGRPACKGPATSIGYLDEEANSELFTDDGWMLMGDLCRIDDGGWLTVTGRISDFIIRGGKNISAAQVEDEVASHPAVALATAVAVPDDVFGERVAVYVELSANADGLTFDDLNAYLDSRGTSKEIRPEFFSVVDALPRSSGGKIAKGALADDATTRFG